MQFPPFFSKLSGKIHLPAPVLLATLIWSVFFSALVIWKYFTYQYHDFDLAYFSQALFNTGHGRLFELTIHPTLTLGDHAEWILLPLSLIYRLLPHPTVLLVLQTLAVASTVFPLYRIADRLLPKNWSRGVCYAFLVLAVPMNAMLFEFHALIFALPLLMWAADAFLRSHNKHFLLFLVAALLIREDVAAAALGFIALAFFEKRNWRWTALPLAIIVAIGIADSTIINHFALAGYKFSLYYSWLGDSPMAVIGNFLANPFTIFAHLFSLPVVEFVLGFFMPVLILPFIRPRWLLISVLPICGIIFQASGGGALALEMHYATLALPGLLLASLEGLHFLLNNTGLPHLSAVLGEAEERTELYSDVQRRSTAGFDNEMHQTRKSYKKLSWIPLRGQDRSVLAIIICIALTISLFTIGPITGIFQTRFHFWNDDAAAAAELIAHVPKDAPVAASDKFLPALANRPVLYSLKYIGLGKTQYALTDYKIKDAPEYIAMDANDAILGAVQYPTLGWTQALAPKVSDNIRALLQQGNYAIIWQKGVYSLWQKGLGNGSVSQIIAGGTATNNPTHIGKVSVYGILKNADCETKSVCVSVTLSLDEATTEDLATTIVFKDANENIVAKTSRIMGDQLLPTHLWKAGETHALQLQVFGNNATSATHATLYFYRPRGALIMGALRSSTALLLQPTTGSGDVTIRE